MVIVSSLEFTIVIINLRNLNGKKGMEGSGQGNIYFNYSRKFLTFTYVPKMNEFSLNVNKI